MAENSETPYTNLIKYVVASDARTRRATTLLKAVALILPGALGAIMLTAVVVGPVAAAVVGALPLLAASAGVIVRQIRGSGPPDGGRPGPAESDPDTTAS